MSIKRTCHAAVVAVALLLSVAHADAAAASSQPVADDTGEVVETSDAAANAVANAADPGAWLAALAGRSFGRMGEEDEPSILVRVEAVAGQGFRIVERERSGTSTTTIAGGQRGARWKGRFASMPIDFKAGEVVALDGDGALTLTWSSWGTTSERAFRLLPDGVLELRSRSGGADSDWSVSRLALLDVERERLLVDQIAIETEIFRQDVDARVKVLMAESAERRRRNREQFWNGLAQATVVLANAAAQVAADMPSSGSAVASGLGRWSLPPVGTGLPAATVAPPSAAPAASAPLRFVMMIGLMNKPGDTVNPTCYSNVVTRPGPAGWGAGGFLPPGSGAQARQSVESLRDRFIAKCRQSGREITSLGNFAYQWNESPGDEQRMADAQPRYPEDVQVSID